LAGTSAEGQREADRASSAFLDEVMHPELVEITGLRNASSSVTMRMNCELLQEHFHGPFFAALILQEIRWDVDAREHDIDEQVVCEIEMDVSLPEMFAVIDDWLLAGHRLRVLPETWKAGDISPGTGVVMLLCAQVLPSVGADVGSTVPLCACAPDWPVSANADTYSWFSSARYRHL
jgi:hypothetical protein